MFERFTWELRATLLGNHARNARDARIVHIRSPDHPTQHPRTQHPAPGTQHPAPEHSTPPQERSTPPRAHSTPHPNTAPHPRNAAPRLAHTPPRTRTHETAPASSHGDGGRGRGQLGERARAYSLTAPAVRPDTMYFCRYWNSRTTGMAAITEPAAKMPHGAVRESAAHMYMPTASVNWL